MIASLSANLHQAYGCVYDKQTAGWCVPQETAPPQKFYDQFQSCADKAFAGTSGIAPSRGATSVIQSVARLEGIAPALLATTWRFESGFDLGNPINNGMMDVRVTLTSVRGK